MNCPKCGIEAVLDIQVTIWQRAYGTFSEDGGTFYATDYETLWDSEQEVKRELACKDCGWTAETKINVVWS